MPSPVAVEIKVDDSPRVKSLECQVDELQAVVLHQREIIRRLSDPEELAMPRLTDIIDIVCKFYSVSRPAITGQTRAPKIAFPRQIACYLGRELTRMSLPEIGRKLGDRDHTTILYGVRKVETLLLTDDVLRDDIDVLKTKIDARVFERQSVAVSCAA